MSRHVFRLAILVVLGIAAAPAGAQARTQRFAPSPEVTVTFELGRPHAAGTLLRLVRNRLAVARSRSGALTLRTPGARAQRLAPARRRTVRVQLTVSASSGTATLTVGRRTASVGSRFVAEDRVVVRSRRVVRALRIQRIAAKQSPTVVKRPAASATAAPTAAPAPAAVAPPPAPVRLFAAQSVWNASLADDAPLDPASDVLVKTLRDTVAQNIAAGWGPWIERGATTPLYTVPANQPTVRVQLDPGSWKLGLQQTFEAVPIPSNAAPAAGPDAHMTVYQPSTDRLWELFKASKLADGWHANFGGAIASASRFPGYYTTDAWPGLSQSYWGATATSLPVIAGTIMSNEVKAGVIAHALAMNIPWARPKVYSWPAQRSDGRSTDPNAIPEGARFRLDPRLDINKLNLPPLTRMMAVAAQRYGIIVRDQTGHAISFFAENSAQYGTDPFGGKTGYFAGLTPNQLTAAFPWEHLQLLKMDLHTTQ